MRRLVLDTERPRWREVVRDQGLVYWSTDLPDGTTRSYWREREFYDFSLDEVERLEADTAELFQMCVEAGDYLVERPDLMRRMGIPEWTHEEIVRTWGDDPPGQSVYGRFDLRYGGESYLSDVDVSLRRPKLLEFNADTPTALPESAAVQWHWLEDLRRRTGQPELDQWNSLHERLVAAWVRNLEVLSARLDERPLVHFTCSRGDRTGEDVMNTQYLRDTCAQAGYETRTLLIEDVLWNADDGRFYEADPATGAPVRHLDVLVKLYPWEWIAADEFGKRAFRDMAHRGPDPRSRGTTWIEAPYTMLWSNKGLLAVLWRLFGDDPARRELLLPAYFEDERPVWMRDYARKPLLGREGANVTLVQAGEPLEVRSGPYGAEGFVCQQLARLPVFPSADELNHPVLGAWLVDGEPAGLGIRESTGLVTDDLSYFAPHTIGYRETP